jgi:hypothetical protein
MRKGVAAERFETPLAGEAAALMCASAFCLHTACQRRGELARPGFPPEGETGTGVQTSFYDLSSAVLNFGLLKALLEWSVNGMECVRRVLRERSLAIQ